MSFDGSDQKAPGVQLRARVCALACVSARVYPTTVNLMHF